MLLHSDERLLEAVIADLENQVLPSVAEEHRFRVRLNINALKMVLRSLKRGGERADAAKADAALAERIRSGETPLGDELTLDLVEAGLRERLSVHNPKWLV